MIRVGGPKAGPAMLPGFVGTMENSPRWWQINHLRLDFHLCEGLAVLDAHHAAYHLEQNDVVPQVPLYPLWLLSGWCLLVGPVQALCSCVTATLGGCVQQLVKVHTTVTDLVEGQQLLLLHVCHLVGSSERTH